MAEKPEDTSSDEPRSKIEPTDDKTEEKRKMPKVHPFNMCFINFRATVLTWCRHAEKPFG